MLPVPAVSRETAKIKKVGLIGFAIVLTVTGWTAGNDRWCDIKIDPLHPTSSDIVTITVSGLWGDSCIPNGSVISADGNNIYFDVLWDYPPFIMCLTVITPWQRTESVGPLSPGRYTVHARISGSPFFYEPVLTEFIVTGQIVYVDDDAAGNNDGSSWQNAYKYLQDALADANSSAKPVEIRVAQGIYKPDQGAGVTPGDRTATFQLINGVTLKGGYAGFGEPEPDARNIELYETILSGDLDGDDVEVNDPRDLRGEPSRAENSYHVLSCMDGYYDTTAVLDGVIITGGNANGPNYYRGDCEGGGMYNHNYGYDDDQKLRCGPTVLNCTFRWNSAKYRGGGMYNYGVDPTLINCTFSENAIMEDDEGLDAGGGVYNVYGQPVFIGCTFYQNYGRSGGGGMCNDDSDAILTNCVFEENRAYEGGAVANFSWSCWPTFENCTFTANWALLFGGGMYNGWSSPKLTNCTFMGNSCGTYGGGMCNLEYGRPTLTNCTFRGNSAGESGGGILNFDDSVKLTLTNCIVSGNSAAKWGGGFYGGGTLTNCVFTGNSTGKEGGAIFTVASDGHNDGYTLTLNNCILWADRPEEIYVYVYGSGYAVPGVHVITYSDVQGSWPGVGNINVDPCFAEPGYWDPNGTPEDANDDFWVDGDYHLKSQAGRWEPSSGSWVKDDVTSLCIDAGDPANPIGYEPFPNGGIINMGAYGGTVEASKSYFGKPVCETIVTGDINGDCIVNFEDFALLALHWLQCADPGCD